MSNLQYISHDHHKNLATPTLPMKTLACRFHENMHKMMFLKVFGLFLVTLSLSPLICHCLSNITTKQEINLWCSHSTPHPYACQHFINRSTQRFIKPESRTDFLKISVQVALDQILKLKKHAQHLRHHCRTKNKKVVWTDCYTLLQNAILQLNRTLEGFEKNNTSEFDAQTWLSTALTNLEICQTGSEELKVPGFVSSFFSGNISQLLSNCLAVNDVLLLQNQEYNYKQGFPDWVNSVDRKLLETTSLASKANVVVAKDGSGNFNSIQAAINYAVSKRIGNERIIVYVKRGVYVENILISSSVNKIMLVGDGLKYTIITGSRSVRGGYTTYSSATFGVDGIAFLARGITFRNTAGPQNGQAPALRSASDLSVFYGCGFEGYQDTLFVQAQRQFYKSCYISGTIDFIFGNAAVVFQNCNIYVRRPMLGQINVITAQGRADPFQNTGISIHNSRVMAAPDLQPVISSVETYLGRPWMQYSRTVFLKSYMDNLVHRAGWLAWEKSTFALDTLYYGEYKNFGPGASTAQRVRWKGYHVIKTANAASKFTVANLIAGQTWLPATGVPFTAGL